MRVLWLLVGARKLASAIALRAEAACDCDCCTAVNKPPIQGDGLMCAPAVGGAPPKQDDPNAGSDGTGDAIRSTALSATDVLTAATSSCPDQCQKVQDDAAVTASATAAVVESSGIAGESTPEVMMYASYCLAECVASSQEAGDVCIAIEEAPAEVLAAAGSSTTPQPLQVGDVVPTQVPSAADRAKENLEARMPEPQLDAPTDSASQEAPTAEDEPLKEEAAAVAQAAAAAATTTAAPTPDTGALVAEASGRLATASALEARAAKAEVQGARYMANSSFSLASAKSSVVFIRKAKAEIAASAVRAAIYAASAKKSAELAKAELAEMERIPLEAADFAADEAAQGFWAEANATALKIAQEEAMMQGPPPPSAAGPAAVRAAAPYAKAMDVMLDSRTSYDSQARLWAAQSQALYANAQQRHAQAHELQSSGHTDAAQQAFEAAKKTLNEAVGMDTKAQEVRAKAEQADAALPSLMDSAAFAANQAGELASVRWMPPPIPATASAPALLAMESRGGRSSLALRGGR